MSEVVLEARGIDCALGEREILRDVSLALRGGECVGLVGPNGAGKTTLIKVLAGLLKPQKGAVLLQGTLLPKGMGLSKRARRGLGYLPQQSSVFWGLSVRENLESVPGARPEDVEDVLVETGLSARAEQLAQRLSGGERRRLEIGRLCLLSPKVLLCDEPFAGLDPQAISALGEMLRAQAARGGGVLICDHRTEALFSICTRALVLVDGAVVREGAPRELKKDPLVRDRYLLG